MAADDIRAIVYPKRSLTVAIKWQAIYKSISNRITIEVFIGYRLISGACATNLMCPDARQSTQSIEPNAQWHL